MSVTLTERAAAHVRKFLNDEPTARGIRFGVKPTGCSGYMYIVNTVDTPTTDDLVFESQGIQIAVDPESLKYLDGTEVDFTRDGLNEGFRFENPNVKETCGCGESFSL